MPRLLLMITLTTFLMSDDSETQSLFTGNANFYYISKLDDGKIIRMPYRMLNTTWINQHKNFELIGTIALEYQPVSDHYSFKMDNPQDFLFDLRELYMTWFLDIGEIRIGKQIQSWGFVDENSPLDNSCAYDYNFLFETGTERKIATTALSTDFYYKSLTFGFTASPFHSINRLPSSNAEFPIDLPIIPENYQFWNIEKANEFGGYIQLSLDIMDIGASYFSGYDRIFNLSGINISSSQNSPFPSPDSVFTYRKTDVIGLGATILIENLTVRADVGYFKTKDLNDNVIREHPTPAYSSVEWDEELYRSYAINEQAEYEQMTIQIEYEKNDLDFLFQYFYHNLTDYTAMKPTEEDYDIPGFEFEAFDPIDYFYPGMGSTLSLLTHNAILGGISKTLLNDRLTIQVRNLMDLDYKGYFFELNTEYKLTDRITSTFAINYINGNEKHQNSILNKGEDYEKAFDYPLNQMQDFSHVRMQIKYSF